MYNTYFTLPNILYIFYFTLILYICLMTVKEFILSKNIINQVELANLMYPTNKSAKTYLSRKLNESDGRSFTNKDSVKALEALKTLAKEIEELGC